MRKLLGISVLVSLVCCTSAWGAENKPIPTIGSVGEINKLKDGFNASGPITADLQGNVYFGDNRPENTFTLFKVEPGKDPEIFLKIDEICGNITFDAKGRLIVSLPQSKKIVAYDIKTKQPTLLTDKFNDQAYEKPTGVAVDDKGGVYFSDPPTGAIYYISSEKKVSKLIDDVPSPGEVLIAPNGKTLYVVLEKTPIVMAYALNAKKPGTLDDKKDKGTVFCTLKKPEEGKFTGSTGGTLDLKGNLFLATATGVQVFDQKGKYLGTVEFDNAAVDCAFGGETRKTLFAATSNSVLTTHIDIPFDPYPLVLLGIGILCIFGFIIYFRMNAFLALIGAALIIGMMSPLVIFGTDPETAQPVLQLLNVPAKTAAAFGNIMGRIGLAIAFATIIGKAMMDSGAADRIVRFFTGLFGEKFAPLALLASGFVLSIPVFFDNVFLLLVPLARALYMRTKKNYLLYVTAIGAGGAVTHSLVPPTPGPIVMSEILHVDLGYTILVGVLVGIPVALSGFCYCWFINKRMPIALRESGSVSLEELEKQAQVEDSQLPPLWLSLLPILLPVLFITSRTVFTALTKATPELNNVIPLGSFAVRPLAILDFLGQPNIALLISAIISMLTVYFRKTMTKEQLGKFTADALVDAGMILLITSAGGAFGAMLTHVGVGTSLNALTDRFSIDFIILAWGLAVLFKVAQGSGTVAMITAAGILWSILKAKMDVLHPGQPITAEMMTDFLNYHPVYLIMAIGCGSKIASWMNDSGFWVVSKMGGLTEAETLKSWTMTLITMGLFGLPFLLILTRIPGLARLGL